MAQSVIATSIAIPIQDSQGNFIDYSAFFKQVASLSLNSQGSVFGQMAVYDNNMNYVGQSTVLFFFILSTNASAALAAYTSFKNGLSAGTITNVWYSTSTLGV